MGLTCRQVHTIGSRYLDHELGWWARIRLHAHLRVCPPCVAYLDQLRQVVYLLRGRAPSPPGQAERRVLGLLGLADRPLESSD